MGRVREFTVAALSWLRQKAGPSAVLMLFLSAASWALDARDFSELALPWSAWASILTVVAAFLFLSSWQSHSARISRLEARLRPKLTAKPVTRGSSVAGKWLEYACLQVANEGEERVKGCTGYLFSVEMETDSGPYLEDDKHPTYLQWSSKDGGGKENTFATQVTLDVAEISGRVFPLVVVDDRQRDQYGMVAGYSYLLDIEVASENAGKVRRKYRLGTSQDLHDNVFEEVGSS